MPLEIQKGFYLGLVNLVVKRGDVFLEITHRFIVSFLNKRDHFLMHPYGNHRGKWCIHVCKGYIIQVIKLPFKKPTIKIIMV